MRPVLVLALFAVLREAAWSQAFPDASFLRLCRDAGYGRDEVARAEVRIQADR